MPGPAEDDDMSWSSEASSISSSSPGKNFLRVEFEFVWVIGLNPACFDGEKCVEAEMSAFLSEATEREDVMSRGGYVMRDVWEGGMVLGGGMESRLDACPRVPLLRRSIYQGLQDTIEIYLIRDLHCFVFRW